MSVLFFFFIIFMELLNRGFEFCVCWSVELSRAAWVCYKVMVYASEQNAC